MALLGEAELSDRSCKTKAFECHKAGVRFGQSEEEGWNACLELASSNTQVS